MMCKGMLFKAEYRKLSIELYFTISQKNISSF